MPAPSPIVAFDAVCKRYGEGPLILDRINFTAAPRDFVSFIGPSGCGKSTLLRLIAGLSPITGGQLLVDGRSPEDAAADQAFVFQEPTLLPWLTVANNVELAQKIRGIPAAERASHRARVLAQVGLANRAGFYPRQLSGGQKMRVSLARALTLSPKIILLDEPFGALDEMTREHLNEELLALRESQAWTAFFVTHSVAEAVFLSNRIVIMNAGPGRIHREITVDLPYPRTEETRRSRAYLDLVAEVGHLLRSVERAA